MAVGDRDRWNDKWAEAGRGTSHGSSLIDLVQPWLPDAGALLDVAGGGSSDSLHFARLGFAVTVADVSDVGLIQAKQRALAEDIMISTVEVDLEADPLPEGPWDVITVANYLQRDLFAAFTERLAPGGVLAVVIATEINHERNEHPHPRFLLRRDELPGLVAGLEVLHHSEAWRDNDRHEAHLVARRSG
ncbi:MAG: class I SAM-dependent methyltransferase [Actinomycetota bacterium]